MEEAHKNRKHDSQLLDILINLLEQGGQQHSTEREWVKRKSIAQFEQSDNSLLLMVWDAPCSVLCDRHPLHTHCMHAYF